MPQHAASPMTTNNTKFWRSAGQLLLAILSGIAQLIGMLLTRVQAGTDDDHDHGEASAGSSGSVRIQVFNPNSRRWSSAGSCINSDAAIEAAMNRAMSVFCFASKVRAVDARTGAVVNFMGG